MEGMFANYVVVPADSPSPPEPFLGAGPSNETLRWTKAEAGTDSSGKDGPVPKVTLQGKVAVYRGFYPQRNPPTVRAAGKEVTLAFRSGTTATGDQATWKVINGNVQGVVLDESMDFELTLTGTAWREILAPAGATAMPVSVEIEMGGVRHQSTLAWTPPKSPDK